MIQANELRRGNLVLFNPMEKIKRICEVMEIKKDRVLVLDMGLDLVLALDEMNPVPLTPDILEKCGFKRQERNDAGFTWFIREAPERFSISMSPNEDFKYLRHLVNLTTLHQLQNLYFAITQTELTINL